MEAPVCLPYERFAARRGERPLPEAFAGLWTAGSLDGLALPCIAIVGTRAATAYGKALATRFAAAFAAHGCCVISGLALGIDAAAHCGALAGDGRTIGVLGSGHDRFFPSRNRKLAEAMIDAGGAVLSPFAPGTAAKPAYFLQRNGIVAALADAVVVVEAPARSGALNTAGWAAGRIPVFAVPGDVDRAHVAGCHALIRDGAILARGPADVLEDLRILPQAQTQPEGKTRAQPADALQARILRQLEAGERTLGDFMRAANEPPANILAALCLLELQGFVEARPGECYARVTGAGAARR
ncbi:MAG: DNA-processing protein DprA [Candidatus Baltobacteraceae bacterium]